MLDGVMMGRAAYQEPWRLLAVDPLLFGEPAPIRLAESGGDWRSSPISSASWRKRHAAVIAITRHVLGLFHARAGRARLPPSSRDRGGQARRRRCGPGEALALVLDGDRNWRNIAAA